MAKARGISVTPNLRTETELFEEARCLQDDRARAAFVESACGGDEELRQRVERLLEVDRNAKRFVAQQPAPSGEATTASSQTTSFLGESTGGFIGRYRLLQPIGEGGMGDVYLAEQREPYLRKVALKIIKWGMDTRQVIARFEAERQALALMNHPHIAKVIDAGATETGRPYFVMELVQGVPITEFCDRETLAINERLELFIPVCQAIQHAHQKGLIHRDIKPSNVLVSWVDGKATPLVIDFGVAKAINQRLTEKTLFTGFGQFIGTPAYVSPEQASPMGLDIDTRADIYSLGVLLYELLTGRTPFDKKTLLDKGFEETRRILTEEDPPRPSARLSGLPGDQIAEVARLRNVDPRRLATWLRGDINWIVMKAIEKDRNRRYDSATGLAEDIRRFLQGDPVNAVKPTPRYRFERFIRRHQKTVVFVGLVVLSLAAGVALSTWQAIEATRARESAREAAQDSTLLAGFFDQMLNSVTPARAQGKDTVLLREILAETSGEVGAQLKDRPELAFKIRSTLGHTYIAIGGWPQAEAELRQSVALARKQTGASDTNVASALIELAFCLQHLGRYDEARDTAAEAVEIIGKSAEPRSLLAAKALHRLGSIYIFLEQFPEAEPTLIRAREIALDLKGPDNSEVLNVERDLAVLRYRQGQLDKMEELITRVLKARRRKDGDDHPDTIKALELVALLRQEQGRFAEAAQHHTELLERKDRILTTNHSGTITTLDNLAMTYGFQGKFAQAEKLSRDAVARATRILGQDHVNTLAFRSNLAEYLRNQGKFAEAEKLFLEIVAARDRSTDVSDLDRAETQGGLAILYRLQGNLTKAEPWARQCLETRRRALSADHPAMADASSQLALVLMKQGNHQAAEPFARAGFEAYSKSRSSGWRRFVAQSQSGACLEARGQAESALPLLVAAFQGLGEARDRIPAIERPRLVEAAEWLHRCQMALHQNEPAAATLHALKELRGWAKLEIDGNPP